GASTPMKRAKATATAAIVPVWITKSNDQPKRKPAAGPYASRRNTYCPPARGIIAASSAQESAPAIVSTPASAQAARSQPGAHTRRADSAEVMKMPEPIIEPTTIIVASSGPSPRTSFAAELSDCELMVRMHIVLPTLRCQGKASLTVCAALK